MDTLLQDVRYSFRMLRKSPMLMAVAILTLALGIGANTAVFSVINAVLLRPLPYAKGDRIFLVTETWREQGGGDVSAGNFNDWKAQSTVFAAMTALQPASFNLASSGSAERVAGSKVSTDFLETFGIQPVRGRFFTPEENQPGHDQVVVLSEKLWRSQFGSDPDILGKTVQVDAVANTVVGVLPAWFDPIVNNDQLWKPIAFTGSRMAEHDDHYLIVLGRLKPGVTEKQAQSELDVIAGNQQKRYPVDDAERGIALMSLSSVLVRDIKPVLLLVMGAAGLVLLIACANIANLQLARGRARRQEIAIRRALGADRSRVVRQMLIESLTVSAVGAAAGLLLAYWGAHWLTQAAPANIPRISETRLDATTLGFAILLVPLSGLISGIIPALRAGSSSLNETFKQHSGTISKGLAHDRTRSAIVASEIALAMMLVVGAGLLIHSAVLLQKVKLGFDPQGVLVGRVSLPVSQFKDPETNKQVLEGMVERIKAMPGVSAAAVVSRAPMRGGGSNGLVPEGRPMEPASAIDSRLRLVSPEYFKVMRVELKRGRLFSDHDVRSSPKVMVINQTLARIAFPGGDAVGKRIACCEPGPDHVPMWHEVVGVVGDVQGWGLDQQVRPEFYLPLQQAPAEFWTWVQNSVDLVARSGSDPVTLAAPMRQAVAQIAPGVPVYEVSTMTRSIALSRETTDFNSFLLLLFTAVALLLAAVGIYGVLSYAVAQRTHEIGIRMALGATRENVLRLVLKGGLRIAAAGLFCGAVGAVLSNRLFARLLFGVKPLDAVSFAAAAGVLLLVSLLASYVPARRATQVDPIVALRYE
jgi:putative ABC transport system permease protein